jgi:hypothetical protein
MLVNVALTKNLPCNISDDSGSLIQKPITGHDPEPVY